MALNTSSYILPSSVDLRPGMDEVPDVKDQGNIGSCLAHAVCTMYETIMDRNKEGAAGTEFVPSRMYLYHWFRHFEARLGEEGGIIKDAFEVLQNKGVCPESEWPYVIGQQDVQPPASCDKSAQKWKIGNYWSMMPPSIGVWAISIEKSLNNIKHALASGRPVVIGIQVSKSFMALKDQKDWKKHTYDPTVDNLGGHGLCCIGYDDATQRLLVQNSWGPEWGDGGFCGIEYKHVGQFWSFQSAYTAVDFPDGVFPVKVPGYVKKVYDTARKNAIIQYVNAQLQPLRDAASEYSVSGDEIENAMRWPEGTWNIVRG